MNEFAVVCVRMRDCVCVCACVRVRNHVSVCACAVMWGCECEICDRCAQVLLNVRGLFKSEHLSY